MDQELCYYSTGFDVKICLCTRKVTESFEKGAPEVNLRIKQYHYNTTFDLSTDTAAILN